MKQKQSLAAGIVKYNHFIDAVQSFFQLIKTTWLIRCYLILYQILKPFHYHNIYAQFFFNSPFNYRKWKIQFNNKSGYRCCKWH